VVQSNLFGRLDRQRHPHVTVGQRNERSRCDPDNSRRNAVERQRLSNDRRVAPEAPFPECLTDHHDLVRTRPFVLVTERAAEDRL
jgi:hypothetical protein